MNVINFECNASVDRNLIDALLNVCSELNAFDRIYLFGGDTSKINPRLPVQKLPVSLQKILSAISRNGYAFHVTPGAGIFVARKFPRRQKAVNHA